MSRKSGGYQGRNSQVDIRYLSGIYLCIWYLSVSCIRGISRIRDKIKKDPTNRIRTSDLRKSMINYSPPLYQLSYGRYPIKGHSGIEYVSGDGAKIKTPSPGIEPGAQT